MKTNTVIFGVTMMLLLALSAAASGYTLGVFGNANEDDTINMQDVTYTELIILEYRDQTDLADAKYDGRINMQDVTQIELIILGRELELTIVDAADRIVAIKMPVERAYIYNDYYLEAIRILGARDKVAALSQYCFNQEGYFPGFSELPVIHNKDYEAILDLNPDLVTTGTWRTAETAEKLSGIPVVGLSLTAKKANPDWFPEGLVKLGYIFDREDAAKHYIDDFHDKYIDPTREWADELSEEEMPKVYVEAFSKPYKVYSTDLVTTAGGRDVFADLSYGDVVDPEDVIMRDPDIIIKKMRGNVSGYWLDDLSGAKAVRDEIMNRPELAEVTAVKNGRVYAVNGKLTYGPSYPVAIMYYAKLFHPEHFDEFDPRAVHQEFLTEFQEFDFNVYEHGVFVYPPLDES